MKRAIIAGLALASLWCAPVRANTWAGCYVGVNAGYSLADIDFNSAPNPSFLGGTAPATTAAIQATAPNSFSPGGVTLGGGVGCNMQSTNWVYGLELDFNYQDLDKAVVRGPFPSGPAAAHTWEERFHSNWFGTMRGRVGVTPSATTLLYFTGGAAFADTSWSKALDFPGFVGFRYAGTGESTRLGWTVGGGYEFIWSAPWSVKIEYLYIDLGRSNAVGFQNAAGSTGAWIHRADIVENVVRIGLNYRY